MDTTTPDEDVGSALPVGAIVAAVIALVMIVGGFLTYRSLSTAEARHRIVIATGSEAGTYHALGTALARVLESEGAVESAEVLVTDGSVANMRLIGGVGGRTADLAFVQSDTPVSPSARLVTPLYKEVLHILVAKQLASEIRVIEDLRGRRVAAGAADSGTRQLATRVLDHFGVVVGEDLALSPEEAAAGLEDGSVEVAIVLTSIPSRLIDDLASRDIVRFLSLGDAQEVGNEADALALVFPTIDAITIPRSTYMRLPRVPVCTVSVSALLVARRGLDPELVRTITQLIFEHRGSAGGLSGDDLAVAQQIHQDYRPAAYQIPFHSGAAAYYNREEPPFFVQYAEAISLGLTLLVGLYSGSIAFREWMKRRMKNRIDAYLIEIDRQTAELGALTLEELVAHRDALDTVRHRAFSDLVSERLLADESFTIFQNHLRDEFAAIGARINEKSKAGH